MEQRDSAVAVRLERELTITRVFDAPRSLVWKAWTDPKHMSRWFGPRDFTTPVCELDVRPGGAWKVVMRAPDGSEFPGGGVYREIVPRERLVFTNNAVDKAGNVLLEGFTTVTFEDENGSTKLTLHTHATAMVDGAEMMLQGMEAGWGQTLDKLGETVVRRKTTITKPSDRELIFTRVFDAPRELLFQVWTDPEHVVQWWGPNGFRTENLGMDVRPGGEWKLIMHGPDGRDYPNSVSYREVVRPERLVWEHGGDGGAVQFEVTVTFEEEDGGTKVSLRQRYASGEARDHVVRTYGAEKGGVQTFERLAEHLSTMV